MVSRTQERSRSPREETRQPERGLVRFDAKAAATDLTNALERRRDQIAGFLEVRDPAEADRFLTVAVDAIVRDASLLSADLLSLVASVRHAAIMGLEPTSVMGEGAIVVYRDSDQGGKKIAQFQPMVRGLQKLARNSGQVAAIGVDVVRRNDIFEYESGSNPRIVHKPFIAGFTSSDAEEPGDVVGAYAYIRLTTGELLPLFMSTAEIHKRRGISKSFRSSGENSIWGKWPEEMMKKTVLRRLLVERAPLSFRAQQALALDAAIDSTDGKAEEVEGAVVTRMQRRLLPAEFAPTDAPQGAEEAEVDEDTGDGANVAPDGSTEPVEYRDDDEAAECGKLGLVEGQRCFLAPHPKGTPHQDVAGGTWL